MDSMPLRLCLVYIGEKAGVHFYRSCLKSIKDPEVRKLLREFIKIEEGHVRRVMKLRENMGKRVYLTAFSVLEWPAKGLAILLGRFGGLRLAYDLEVRGVDFYKKLLNLQDTPSKRAIYKILQEEERQVQRLREMFPLPRY